MYPRLPRAKRHPKGNTFPSLTAARDRQPSPAGGRRSAQAQTDPPKRFFSLDRARPVSLLARPKGAPAAPRAVGRGGARERAQFSPQAETELSGLCDDDMGGASWLDQPPGGSRHPVAAIAAAVISPFGMENFLRSV